jgi:hypothetical protein
MIDCMRCGEQMWSLLGITDESVRIECDECGEIDSLLITGDVGGGGCDFCQNHFEIAEHLEDEHIILDCQNDVCDGVAEVWLRADELDCK